MWSRTKPQMTQKNFTRWTLPMAEKITWRYCTNWQILDLKISDSTVNIMQLNFFFPLFWEIHAINFTKDSRNIIKKKKVKKKTENNLQCYLFNNMKKQKTITRDDRIASKSHDVKTTDPLWPRRILLTTSFTPLFKHLCSAAGRTRR